jgi:hypothetical protein
MLLAAQFTFTASGAALIVAAVFAMARAALLWFLARDRAFRA